MHGIKRGTAYLPWQAAGEGPSVTVLYCQRPLHSMRKRAIDITEDDPRLKLHHLCRRMDLTAQTAFRLRGIWTLSVVPCIAQLLDTYCAIQAFTTVYRTVWKASCGGSCAWMLYDVALTRSVG